MQDSEVYLTRSGKFKKYLYIFDDYLITLFRQPRIVLWNENAIHLH